jgi:hypothetical protein
VIDVVLKEQLERAIGLALRDAGKGCGAEERPPALVTGTSEGCARDHVVSMRRPMRAIGGRIRRAPRRVSTACAS